MLTIPAVVCKGAGRQGRGGARGPVPYHCAMPALRRAASPAPTTCIALLRAINLAGRNRVPMAGLRGLLADLGFREVRSLLQSGNLVFQAGGPAAALERRLEAATRERLGVTTDYFVRTAAEWAELVAANPFPAEARKDPGRLLVLCLREAPSAQRVAALRQAISGRERVETVGRHAYVVYPDGVGRSRLTSTLIEKHLGTRMTGRNWNTVLKLQALARP